MEGENIERGKLFEHHTTPDGETGGKVTRVGCRRARRLGIERELQLGERDRVYKRIVSKCEVEAALRYERIDTKARTIVAATAGVSLIGPGDRNDVVIRAILRDSGRK